MNKLNESSETSQSPEIVTHNFDAVNRYFQNHADKVEAEIGNIRGEARFRRFLAWGKIFPGIALIVLAVGGLLVLAGIGWRIANVSEVAPNGLSTDVDRGKQLTDRVKENLDVGVSEESSHKVEGFVVFVSGESDIPAAPELTTGIQYDDSVSFEPISQWCYLKAPNPLGSSIWLTLRSWDQYQGHYIKAFTSELAEQFGTSIYKLEQLSEECQFIGDGRLDPSSVQSLIERNKRAELAGVVPKEFTTMIGTGFFVSEQGHIVTNSHVVDQCQSLVVHRNGVSNPATIVFDDASDDLAILKTDLYPAVVADWSGSDIRPGDDVIAVGYPLQGLLSKELKITKGLVNSLAGIGNDGRMMQVSAEVQPGNSGGPLLNNLGQVIGVVTSKVDALKLSEQTGDIAQNINFAIKGEVVKKHLEKEMIDYSTTTANSTMDTADIFERAREFTVLVECKI